MLALGGLSVEAVAFEMSFSQLFPFSLPLQQILPLFGDLDVPHGLQDASDTPLGPPVIHVGLQLVVDVRQALGTVLLAHLVVGVASVDGPELLLGVVSARVQQLGAEQLRGAQLELAVEIYKGVVVARSAAIHADTEDTLVADGCDRRVEPVVDVDLARRLERTQEDLALRHVFGDVLDELFDGGRWDTKILHHVFVRQPGFVEGHVAGTGVEEGVCDGAGESILGDVKVLEGELAPPEGTVIIAEEVVGKRENDRRDVCGTGRALGLDRRGFFVFGFRVGQHGDLVVVFLEVSLNRVGKPVDLLGGQQRRSGVASRVIDELSKHDNRRVTIEVDAVDVINGRVRGRLLEDVRDSEWFTDRDDLHLDVRFCRNQLDRDQGDETKRAQRTAGFMEEISVALSVGSFNRAVTQHNFNFADGVLEESITVHAALARHAGKPSSTSDALEFHDDLRNKTSCDAMGGQGVHGYIWFGLHCHSFFINREQAMHVTEVDHGISRDLLGSGGGCRTMVHSEVPLFLVEKLDLGLDAPDGCLMLLEEFCGVHLESSTDVYRH